MSIGKRIKHLRKEHLKINQAEFGKALGLAQTTVAGYEKELRNVSEASILSICKEYNVSEEWLRTGEGDMFVQLGRVDEIAKFTADLFNGEPNSFKERMILALASLNEQQWELLEEISEQIKKDQR